MSTNSSITTCMKYIRNTLDGVLPMFKFALTESFIYHKSLLPAIGISQGMHVYGAHVHICVRVCVCVLVRVCVCVCVCACV